MKYLLLLFFTNILLEASRLNYTYYRADVIPENMSVSTKKDRFYQLVVPAVQKVYREFLDKYERVKSEVHNPRYEYRIKQLRAKHKVKTNLELLQALKPHPPSIAIAQAAMESAWATSRFFREANNVFGMWSKNPKEARIPAGVKRADGRQIYLRKFYSIEDSVREYYKLMGRSKHFREFREVRHNTNDVFEIIKKLDKYSEIGHVYTEELGKMIRFNKLTKYDKVK